MPVSLDKQILVFLECDCLRKLVGAKVVTVMVVEAVVGEAGQWCKPIF